MEIFIILSIGLGQASTDTDGPNGGRGSYGGLTVRTAGVTVHPGSEDHLCLGPRLSALLLSGGTRFPIRFSNKYWPVRSLDSELVREFQTIPFSSTDRSPVTGPTGSSA